MDAYGILHLCAHKYKEKTYLKAATYVVLILQLYRWSKILLAVREAITYRKLRTRASAVLTSE